MTSVFGKGDVCVYSLWMVCIPKLAPSVVMVFIHFIDGCCIMERSVACATNFVMTISVAPQFIFDIFIFTQTFCALDVRSNENC